MNLYTDQGYLDMGAVISAPYPFIIVVGARGCGKTYGALKNVLEDNIRFIYLRRTKAILDVITDRRFSPFKKLNEDLHRDIQPEISKGYGMYKDMDTGDLIGYAAALSTIANLRGFDGSDIELMIYDEFIPEPTEIVRFNEFSAFTNAYETINRNREFEGRPPLKAVLLSNSDLLYSTIVSGFHLSDTLVQMQEEGLEWVEFSPDILLVRPDSVKFKEQKQDTALYRVTQGTEFQEMSLHNMFIVQDRERVKYRPLKEFNVVCCYNGMYIYKHKTDSTYYVCRRGSGTPKVYQNTDADNRRFKREQMAIWRAFLRKKVYFETVDVQTDFLEVYK